MSKKDLEHNIKMTNMLSGKKVKLVQYMDEQNAIENGFSSRPVIIVFEDDSMLVPMSDEEGNDGGAMSYTDKKSNQHIVYTL